MARSRMCLQANWMGRPSPVFSDAGQLLADLANELASLDLRSLRSMPLSAAMRLLVPGDVGDLVLACLVSTLPALLHLGVERRVQGVAVGIQVLLADAVSLDHLLQEPQPLELLMAA